MIYAVNFLRDIASRREFPGTRSPARARARRVRGGMKEKKKKKKKREHGWRARGKEIRGAFGRGAYSPGHAGKRVFRVTQIANSNTGVALFVKSSGRNEISLLRSR